MVLSTKPPKFSANGLRILSVCALILVWQLAAWWLQDNLLPAPMAVVETIWHDTRSGELPRHLSATLMRVLVAPELVTSAEERRAFWRQLKSLAGVDKAVDLEAVANQAKAEMAQKLTANLLKLCNSAYYGLRRQVGTTREALVMLGNRTVVSLAFAASLGDVMRGPLAAYRQAAAMTPAPVTTEIHQPFDIHRYLPASVTFDHVIGLDHLTQLIDIVTAEIVAVHRIR